MRRITVLILAVIFTVFVATSVSSAMYVSHTNVRDNANLLTDSERQSLNAKLGALPNSYDYDVVVLTEYSVGNLAYHTEQFYLSENFDENTVILLYCLDTNEAYIDVWGGCQAVISDNEMDNLFDLLGLYINQELYYEAFDSFADRCGIYLGNYISTNGYLPDMDDGNAEWDIDVDVQWYHLLIIAAVVGIVVGFISVFVMKSKLRSVKSVDFASDYYLRDSMTVRQSHEIFLYRTVVRTARSNNNSSGRGGGGGRSHRGSGRRF